MLYPDSDTRPARIFICHASEDEVFANAVASLLIGIGVEKESILCTSKKECSIKVGSDWVEELRRSFTDYRVYVIIIHSSHLYSSPVSMNEMGAAWVKECPIFSFLVNGFMESSMAGVLTSNHQSVLVGRKDISTDIDQLRDNVIELFGIEVPKEDDDWKPLRDEFIKSISSLPADKGIVTDQFDIDTAELIHIQEMPLWDEEGKSNEKNVTWAEILKAVAKALRTMHTEGAISDALQEVWPGIIQEDVMAIIDKLHHFGLAEVTSYSTEYEGSYVAWCFSEKGRQAYERAKNYHLQSIFQERDKAQIVELMSYFSTDAMDEYLREGPEYITDVLLLSSEAWNSIVGSSSFQIFDPSLKAVLEPFYESLMQVTSHGECYENANNRKYKLHQTGFGIVNKQHEETVEWLYSNMPEMRKRYFAFIQYVKTHYPTIDLKELSARFEKECSR